jgi:hypothetical protein
MVLRATSSYLILFTTDDPNKTLDQLVKQNQHLVPIETTAVYTGMCGLRFRCRTSDDTALEVARQIADGQEFILRTGYGVNQREIAQ